MSSQPTVEYPTQPPLPMIIVEVSGPIPDGSAAITLQVSAPGLDVESLRRELASQLKVLLPVLHCDTVDSVAYRSGRITMIMSHPDHPGHRTIESVLALVPAIIEYIDIAAGYRVFVLRPDEQLVLVDCSVFDHDPLYGLVFELPAAVELYGGSMANQHLQRLVSAALSGYPGIAKVSVRTEGDRRVIAIGFTSDQPFVAGRSKLRRIIDTVLGLISIRASLASSKKVLVRPGRVDAELVPPGTAGEGPEDPEDAGLDQPPGEY